MQLPNLTDEDVVKYKARVDKVRMSILGRESTVWNTVSAALYVIRNKIPGDFVECGVAYGGQPAIMASVADFESSRRDIYLYDSFVGIPKGGPRDHTDITNSVGTGDGSLITSGVSACDEESVKRNLKRWGINPNGARHYSLKYIKGWFQDTLPSSNHSQIALLRLDGDLYASTKVCMEILYPKVIKGGVVIIDDYHLTGCREAIHEVLDSLNEPQDIITTIDDIQPVRYFIKK